MRLGHLIQAIVVTGLTIGLAGASCFGATVLYVDDDAPPGGDGQSWQTAFTYLQDALYAARIPGSAGAGAPGHGVPGAEIDEIHVAQGCYQPDQDEAGQVTPGDREASFALISGVSLKGGYAGLGAPDPDERDIELYETIFTGDLAGDDQPDFVNYDENSYHVVSALDCDNTAILDGFTITAGHADGAGPHEFGAGLVADYPGAAAVHECSFVANRADWGGGIFNWGIETMVSACTFSDNIATSMGGGVYLGGSSSSVVDSTFLGNTAEQGGGAALSSYEGSVVTGCTFIENSAVQGGAIYSRDQDYGTTISNCVLAANNAEKGGALAVDDHSYLLEMCDCTCIGNSAVEGGGVWKTDTQSALIDVTCTGNSAVRGGGVYSWFGANLHQCVLEKNDAAWGGGLYLYQCRCYPYVDDCVIACNTADYDGGGVYVELNKPHFTGCTFTNNAAGFYGGAVYVTAADPIITDCTFTSNVAELGGGGYSSVADRALLTRCAFEENLADCGAGLHSLAGAPTLTDCRFTANAADKGGGAYALRSKPALYDCAFSENEATAGGGFHDEEGTSLLIHCTFKSNSAASGGGLYAASGASTAIDCLLSGNSAGRGGAMTSYLDDVTTLINCLIKGNVAERGGGLHTSCGHPTLINCALIANTADDSGGAIEHSSDEPQVLINCTLAGNAAGYGAGAVRICDGGAILTNCVVWANGDDPIWGDPTITFSCIEHGYEGEGNIDADPLFVDPDDDDDRLLPGSPCIDAADNDAVLPDEFDLDEDGDIDEPLPIDLDGNPRFVEDPDTEDTGHGDPPIVDMGAYEYQLDTCPADFDDDGDVDAADLLHLLAAWGTPNGDVDGDGDTDTADLLALLAAWGQCP
jgi:predicted outer membrane repeat protein